MSILIEEEKRPIPWLPIAVGLLIVGAISAGTYYLFFAAQPGIEKIVLPPALQSASNISALEIEPSAVINSSEFRSLRAYTGLPSAGELGKTNPFMP